MGILSGVSAGRLSGVLFMLFGGAMACSAGSSDSNAASGSVWAPTTVPFDPTCKNCQTIGSITLPHIGEATLVAEPGVDDPEQQWTSCFNGILDCIEDGSDETNCVSKSHCPGACKDDYRIHLTRLGKSDLKSRWAALEAVFVQPTSRCAVPRAPQSEVAP